MRYSVTLERSGRGYTAWIHELPGCYAHGASREEVLTSVPDAIDHFRGWLGGGEDIPEDQIQFEVVEAAASAEQTDEGSTGVLLTWDQQPLTQQDWERIERWLHRSRTELLRTVDNMREEDLDIKAREGARTIARQLQHISSVEYMYALWTFDLRSKDGLKEFLEWTRRMALDRMRTLAGRRDHHLTYAEWAGDEKPEPWSARKAARRLVYHELWHLRSIRRLLQGFRGASGARP